MIIGIDASRAFVPNPAGPEYYSWHLIKNISKIDKINHYILYLRSGQKPDFRLPGNFETKTIRFPYLWTQLGLALETIFSPPDVLFVPAHTLPLLTRFLRPKLPIVVTVHGLEGKYLPQTGFFPSHIYRNWSISWAVRFATRLIAVSEDTKKDVIKSFKLDENISKDIKTIYEGVDYSRFALAKNEKRKTQKVKEIKEKYGISGNYVLFVGTVQPRKNLVRLIKAFSLLLANVRESKQIEANSKKASAVAVHSTDYSSLTLVIAGKFGWLYEKILKAPKGFGVEERVRFTGRVEDEDLPALYWGARAFVFPSLTEGFGLPILEAQAAGLPVVAAKAGAIPEVSGGAALLINPRDVQDIEKGLGKILTDKKLRRELIKRGRENAQRFGWVSAADSTIDLLLETAKVRR